MAKVRPRFIERAPGGAFEERVLRWIVETCGAGGLKDLEARGDGVGCWSIEMLG